MGSDHNAAVASGRESAAVRGSDNVRTQAREPQWAQVVRSLVLVAAAMLLAAAMIDSIIGWKVGRTLSRAANAAAKEAISTPLGAKNCAGTPCSIESAAEAAKAYLINAGYSKASCVDPRTPSFSGVLVWEFSCGASAVSVPEAALCDTNEDRVCVKVDMTPVKIQPNGKVAEYTRATVQYPHGSVMAFILRPLPERMAPRLPKSVSGVALLRDSS